MKELMNKAGDLAMVVNLSEEKEFEGITVECISYGLIFANLWKVYSLSHGDLFFPDNELVPLGGEYIVQDEPQPELTQGSKAKVPREELCL